MNNFNPKLLGERLKNRRKELKITQQAMAESLNTTVYTISRIENGRLNMSLSLLIDICDYLEFDVAKAISGISIHQDNYLNDDIITLISKLDSNTKEMVQEIILSIVNHSK